MNDTVETASRDTIYLPSFMKIGAGVQEILRFCLSNFRACNVVADHFDYCLILINQVIRHLFIFCLLFYSGVI
jgi:hypothetical protein